MRVKMNAKSICFTVIIIICIVSLSYGIYYEIFIKNKPQPNPTPISDAQSKIEKFDELFDNSIHLQDFDSANFIDKLNQSQEIVYSAYNINETDDNKYDIKISIPLINIRNENAMNIDREILSLFYNKMNKIKEDSKQEDAQKTLYSVSYTAYMNENILSLVIRATLKEGSLPQRVIMKAYTYNISTNEKVDLEEILEIKGINKDLVQENINTRIQDAASYVSGLSELGYEIYKRDVEDEMYRIENSDNYFLGPNGEIYIIYAYGNMSFTSERDIVYIG